MSASLWSPQFLTNAILRPKIPTHRLFRRIHTPLFHSASATSTDTAFSNYTPHVAFLFPGQGAQKLGMAKSVVEEIPRARELFNHASEILGYDLLQLCIHGPVDELNSTVISQPALFVSSLAAVEKLKETQGTAILDSCDVTCGLSLGEYTALTFAGALDFETGLKLVQLRGEAMQLAADASDSGMVSVIGLTAEKVDELCNEATKRAGENEYVKIANYLCPGNYTVSGSKKACEVVEKIAKAEFGARMTVKLAVAGAFHTEFMNPAVEKLQEALHDTSMRTPRIPVVSNVDCTPHSDPEVIKEILAKQVTSPVRWEDSMRALLDKGLERSYELGPGKVVAGIFKRIDKTHPIENIEI
eukprot:g3810.t1